VHLVQGRNYVFSVDVTSKRDDESLSSQASQIVNIKEDGLEVTAE
jgi:hypothetical protein